MIPKRCAIFFELFIRQKVLFVIILSEKLPRLIEGFEITAGWQYYRYIQTDSKIET